MKHYYINCHFGYSKDPFENFATVELLFCRKEPSERTIRKALHQQGNAVKPIRSIEWTYDLEEVA
jgi:hypothetical protein